MTADAHVAPDVARLRDYIRICFEELYRAAVPPVTRPRRASRARAAAAVETASPAEAAVAETPTAAPAPENTAEPLVAFAVAGAQVEHPKPVLV